MIEIFKNITAKKANKQIYNVKQRLTANHVIVLKMSVDLLVLVISTDCYCLINKPQIELLPKET